MAMKQTQTKMFDFSDVGLDFCSGSKTLFPDRFKKMLATGYNSQTVASVAVAGNQVTLTYGVSHGYAADRVLKIESGVLAGINGGEFWIDSVTTNTLTFTLDDAPVSISGAFTTKIASLGWSLEYENANVHVYKFKHIDDSDLLIRLCFQDQTARRNCISPCIGRSFNLSTGFITDENAISQNKEITSPGDGFKWEFSRDAVPTQNSFTYSQGVSTYGKGQVVGSQYHLVLMNTVGNGVTYINLQSILPAYCHASYDRLNYPLIMGHTYGSIAGTGIANTLANMSAYVGNIAVGFDTYTANSAYLFMIPQASASYLALETFNLTTAAPISIFEQSTKQHLGYVSGGAYVAKYANTNSPTITKDALPLLTQDVDLSSKVLVHCSTAGGAAASTVFFAVPIEEIKIA